MGRSSKPAAGNYSLQLVGALRSLLLSACRRLLFVGTVSPLDLGSAAAAFGWGAVGPGVTWVLRHGASLSSERSRADTSFGA